MKMPRVSGLMSAFAPKGGEPPPTAPPAEAGSAFTFDQLTPEQMAALEALADDDAGAEHETEEQLPAPAGPAPDAAPEDAGADGGGGGGDMLSSLGTLAEACREEAANYCSQLTTMLEQAKESEDGDPKAVAKILKEAEKLATEVESAADDAVKAVDGEDAGKAATAAQEASDLCDKVKELFEEAKGSAGTPAPASGEGAAAAPKGGAGGRYPAGAPAPAAASQPSNPWSIWARRAGALG